MIESGADHILENANRMAQDIRRGNLLLQVNIFNKQPVPIDKSDALKIADNEALSPFFDIRIEKGKLTNFAIGDVSEFTPEAYIALDSLSKTVSSEDGKPTQVKLFKTSVSEALQEKAWKENTEFNALQAQRQKYLELEKALTEKRTQLIERAGKKERIGKLAEEVGRLEQEVEAIRIEDINARLAAEFESTGQPKVAEAEKPVAPSSQPSQPVRKDTVSRPKPTEKKKVEIKVDKLEKLKPEDVAGMEPTKVLARLIADVQKKRLDRKTIPLLEKRFGYILRSDGTIDDDQLLKVVAELNSYWKESPLKVATMPADELAILPEAVITDQEVLEIQNLVEQVELEVPGLRSARANEVLGRQQNYAVLLRSVFSNDELREISTMLREEWNAFRLVQSGKVLTREESFDLLVNAYGSLGKTTQQELLDLLREAIVKKDTSWTPPNYEWLTHQVPYSVKPEIYQNQERYHEFQETTVFELAELADGKDLTPHEWDSFDFGRRKDETERFLGRLVSSSEKLEQLEYAFKEFSAIVKKSIVEDRKDYLQAIVAAKKAMDKTNPSGWRRMKQIAYAVQHLNDIEGAQLRDNPHLEAADHEEKPTMVLHHALPEVVTKRFLKHGWRREGVVTPDAFVETIPLDRDTVVCLLGPNGSGKSTLLKTLTSPLPAFSGTAREGGKIDYKQGGVALKGESSSPLGFIEPEEVTDPASSHFQKRAQFMLDALLARDDRRVFMDESSGTSPDWGITLDTMLQLLGVDRSTHTPIEVNRFMKTILGEKDFARRVAIKCMVNHRLTDNQLITLSGGAQLAMLTGPTPEYYSHLANGVVQAKLPVAQSPEYEVLSSYLANVDRDRPLYVTPEDLQYLGFASGDGEIALLVSTLLDEGFRQHKAPALEQLNITARQVNGSVAEAMYLWSSEPAKFGGRQALMKFFLPAGDQLLARKTIAGKIADYVSDDLYFKAIDTIQPELGEHYRNLGSLSLLPHLLRGDLWASVRVLTDINSFNQHELDRYCKRLGQTGFFTPQGKLLLERAPSMLGGLAHLKKSPLRSLSGRERLSFQKDVEEKIRKEAEYNAHHIVGFSSVEQNTIHEIEENAKELAKKRGELEQERGKYTELKRGYEKTVLDGFLEGLSEDERAALEGVYRDLSKSIHGAKSQSLEQGIAELLEGDIINRYGLTHDPTIQALYLVLSEVAGEKMLGEVIGRGFWRETTNEREPMWKYEIDDDFLHVHFKKDKSLQREPDHPQTLDVIIRDIEKFKNRGMRKRNAAMLTGKLLGIIASRTAPMVKDRKVQTTNFCIDYLKEDYSTKGMYTQEMRDFAALLESQRNYGDRLERLENEVGELEKNDTRSKKDNADIFKKHELLKQFKKQATEGRLSDIIRTYRELKRKLPADSTGNLEDIDHLMTVATAADPTEALRTWLKPQLPGLAGTNKEAKSVKQVEKLTMGDLVDIANKLHSGTGAMRDVLERYIARATQAELNKHGMIALKEEGLKKVSDDVMQALATLGFAAAFREVGQYGESNFGGNSVDVEGGVNLQVLARMGEVEAKRENHPSMSQRAKIRRAMRRWKLMGGKIDADVAIIQDKHGGKKTTGMTMNGANMLYTKAWGYGPFDKFSAPDVAAVRFLKDEGTGPNLSAHQRFVFSLRDALWDMRQLSLEGKKTVLFGDEVGQGTKPIEGQLEVDAALRTVRDYGGHAVFISQDPDTVNPAKSDPGINAKIIGVSDDGQFIERDSYAELGVLDALEMKGWPKSAVELARKIYEIQLRTKQQGAFSEN